MDKVQIGTLLIWLTRIMFAMTFGVAFWLFTHPTTTREVIGYGLFIIVWTAMCMGWLKILETLRDEAMAEREDLFN